jgi:antitoxin ParD1/3/4
MNVSLTSELEKFVVRKVQSGRYQTASEVIREGLRLLEDRDRLRELRLEEVRRRIQTGVDELDRRERVEGETVFEEMKEKSTARRTRKR